MTGDVGIDGDAEVKLDPSSGSPNGASRRQWTRADSVRDYRNARTLGGRVYVTELFVFVVVFVVRSVIHWSFHIIPANI